jgi:hypothetical protein
MTGEDLQLSGTRADFDTSPGASGRPIVTMEFTGKGSGKFERITRDEWIRGKLRQQPQHFAIVLDREIKTFPQIDYTDSSLSGGIGGGRAQIQGLDSFQEAKDIALVLHGRATGEVRRAGRPTSRRSGRTRSSGRSAPVSAAILIADLYAVFRLWHRGGRKCWHLRAFCERSSCSVTLSRAGSFDPSGRGDTNVVSWRIKEECVPESVGQV